MVNNVVFVVEVVVELPLSLTAITLTAAFLCISLYTTQDQDSFAVIFHTLKGVHCNSVVNVADVASLTKRWVLNHNVKVSTLHIGVKRVLIANLRAFQDTAKHLKAVCIQLIGNDVVFGRTDQQHPVTSCRFVNGCFFVNAGQLRGYISQRSRGRVGLLSNACRTTHVQVWLALIEVNQLVVDLSFCELILTAFSDDLTRSHNHASLDSFISRFGLFSARLDWFASHLRNSFASFCDVAVFTIV